MPYQEKYSNDKTEVKLNGADRRWFFLALCRFSDEKLEMHHAYSKQENTRGIDMVWANSVWNIQSETPDNQVSGIKLDSSGEGMILNIPWQSIR